MNMLAEQAYEIIDDVECSRWSSECDDYARLVIYEGEIWLAVFYCGEDELREKIDDPWNVDIDEVNEIWG